MQNNHPSYKSYENDEDFGNSKHQFIITTWKFQQGQWIHWGGYGFNISWFTFSFMAKQDAQAYILFLSTEAEQMHTLSAFQVWNLGIVFDSFFTPLSPVNYKYCMLISTATLSEPCPPCSTGSATASQLLPASSHFPPSSYPASTPRRRQHYSNWAMQREI